MFFSFHHFIILRPLSGPKLFKKSLFGGADKDAA
jgi:hypothetical protein